MDDQKKAAELAAAKKLEATADALLQQKKETYTRDKIIGTLTGTLGGMEKEMQNLIDLRDAARRRREELGG